MMQIRKFRASEMYKNLSALTMSEVVIRIAKFILLAIAARILGPEEFGVFNYLLATAALIAVVGDFGINRIITRNVAKDNKLVSTYLGSFLIQIFVMVGYIVLATTVLVLTENVVNVFLFISLAVFTTANVLGDYLWSFLRATEEMVVEARAKTAQAITVLLAGLALLFLPWPLLGLGVSYLLGSLVTLVLAVKHVSERYDFEWKVDWKAWFELLRKSWPIAIVAVSAFVFNQIDSIMLGAYNLFDQVGYYNAAYRIIAGLLIPVFILNQVLFPKISKASSAKSIALVRKNLLANFLIYSVVLAGIILIGKPVLGLVYGAEFMVAQKAFVILGMTLLLTSLVYPLSNYSIAKDYLNLNLALSVIAAIINISLNFFLIPTYGYEGAALATLVTYSFLLCGYATCLMVIKRI